MRARAGLRGGLSLALLLAGALAVLAARFPGLGAELTWSLRSILRPPGKPLQ